MNGVAHVVRRRWRHTDARRAKVTLSTLWIFAVLNYLYADVMSLFDPAIQSDIAAGSIGSLQITEAFLLAAAVLMETAIVMVVLSRVLGYRANRWANIVVGVLHTVAVTSSLTVGSVALYSAFFAVVEIACTVFIVGYAWRWADVAPRSVA